MSGPTLLEESVLFKVTNGAKGVYGYVRRRAKPDDVAGFLELYDAVFEREGSGARGCLTIDGESVPGSQSSDLTVHPKQRRKGLFQQTIEVGLEMRDDDSVIFFGVPGDPLRQEYLKTGWRGVLNPVYL